jgi:hypothetical protein
LGLRWKDIDLVRHSMRVTGSLQQRPHKRPEIAATKTARSRESPTGGMIRVEGVTTGATLRD